MPHVPHEEEGSRGGAERRAGQALQADLRVHAEAPRQARGGGGEARQQSTLGETAGERGTQRGAQREPTNQRRGDCKRAAQTGPRGRTTTRSGPFCEDQRGTKISYGTKPVFSNSNLSDERRPGFVAEPIKSSQGCRSVGRTDGSFQRSKFAQERNSVFANPKKPGLRSPTAIA